MKFIIVSGGVLSGLGKGITAASIGLLLKSRGYKVTAIKCDMYLNIDAGTMNPIQHGEVFVTHDGVETDQDLGHYERFLDQNFTKENYMTSGQIYKIVLDKERKLEYGGDCVQPYHHLPPEIIQRWYEASRKHKAEIVVIELGGTAGEYEGLLFFESVRRLKLKQPKDVILVHVGYLPTPSSIGELKSKPIQQSISTLNSLGIQPDIVVGRAERQVDKKRKEKIALASGLSVDDIVSNPDMGCICEVPIILEKQNISKKILKKLGLKSNGLKINDWSEMSKKHINLKRSHKIAIIGKYQRTGDYMLSDSYVCVVEALKHAGWKFDISPEIVWIDSERLERCTEEQVGKYLNDAKGIVVPQGWGSRGIEGKICAIKYARENNIPFLGLCFGMQMAAIEFARNVCGLKKANSEEVNEKSPHKVIHTMESQIELLKEQMYGGTIRLGAWPCVLREGSKLQNAYEKYGKSLKAPWYKPNPKKRDSIKPIKSNLIFERHRHRYEFNKKYKDLFEKNGIVFSGLSPDGQLVEALELKGHPFFVGTQFHPEYLSRPLRPHPLFLSFIEATLKI